MFSQGLQLSLTFRKLCSLSHREETSTNLQCVVAVTPFLHGQGQILSLGTDFNQLRARMRSNEEPLAPTVKGKLHNNVRAIIDGPI